MIYSLEFVRQFAKYFANSPTIAYIQIFNELDPLHYRSLPNYVFTTFIQNIVKIIRQNDQNHLISSGINVDTGFGLNPEKFLELNSPTLGIGLLTIHDYTDTSDGLANYLSKLSKLNIPFIIEEFSSPSNFPISSRTDFLKKKVDVYRKVKNVNGWLVWQYFHQSTITAELQKIYYNQVLIDSDDAWPHICS